jgi:hypothetical protein
MAVADGGGRGGGFSGGRGRDDNDDSGRRVSVALDEDYAGIG